MIVLTLVVLAFFWPLMLAGQWVPRGGGDLVSFLWPMYRFAARSLRAGTVPLWNPYLYSGAPFVADNQSGVFYPVNLLVFALFGEPSYEVMEALVVFHIWLAGIGLFALARGLGRSRLAALAGGIAFALSDPFVTHIGNLNLNATAAWLPLFVLLTHRALTRESAGWAAGAGMVLAVAALAGHGQMLLFLALTLALYLLYRLVADWRLDWRHRGRTLGLATLIVAVGVGGAALMLLPAREMAAHTGRGHLSYEEATRYSLPPRALLGLLAPGFYGRGSVGFWGPWDRVEVGYVGVATLVLAILGVGMECRLWIIGLGSRVSDPLVPTQDLKRRRLGPREDLPVAFFAFLVGGALLLAMGRYVPLYRLVYQYVPTFDQVRAPARLVVLVDLGLAVLAAHGFDRLLLRARDRHPGGVLAERGARQSVVSSQVISSGRGLRAWLGRVRLRKCRGNLETWVGLGVLVAGGLLLAMGLPQARTLPPPDRAPQAMASVVIAAALLGLSGMLVGLMGLVRRRWPAWLLLTLLAADLVGLGSTLEAEPNDPTLGFHHEDVVAFLRRDPGFFRIEGAAGAWQPDAALVHGLYDIGGVYNPLGLAPYQAYRWAVGERGAPLYNLLGVKYILANKGQPPGDERLVLVYTGNPEIDVYLNTVALPRALLVYRPHVVADHTAAWEAIHAPEFDPERTVVLERGQVVDAGCRMADNEWQAVDGGSVSLVRYELSEVELAVRTSAGGILVLSDVYYPGWRAEVDGAPTQVLRADYVFRAVLLPPGEHTVRMVFAPWTWRVGLAISIITWVGVGILSGKGIRRRLLRCLRLRP